MSEFGPSGGPSLSEMGFSFNPAEKPTESQDAPASSQETHGKLDRKRPTPEQKRQDRDKLFGDINKGNFFELDNDNWKFKGPDKTE